MSLIPGPGCPGETKSATLASGSAVSLSTGAAKSVTGVTLSLEPGVWELRGVIDFQFASNTSYTQLQGSISTTVDALSGTQDQTATVLVPATVPTAALDPTLIVPAQFATVRTTTTFRLVAQATFTVSTCKAYGSLVALRIR